MLVDCVRPHLRHVSVTISSTGEDGGLDAGFLQGFIVEDPVFQAIDAFTRLTEEDPLRFDTWTKLC